MIFNLLLRGGAWFRDQDLKCKPYASIEVDAQPRWCVNTSGCWHLRSTRPVGVGVGYGRTRFFVGQAVRERQRVTPLVLGHIVEKRGRTTLHAHPGVKDAIPSHLETHQRGTPSLLIPPCLSLLSAQGGGPENACGETNLHLHIPDFVWRLPPANKLIHE